MRFAPLNLVVLFWLSFSALAFASDYTELYKLPVTIGRINAMTTDPAGNLYLTGSSNSTSFPATPGAIQTALGGGTCLIFTIGPTPITGNTYPCADAFLVKIDPTGKVVYATYLGGTADDIGYSVAADAAGNAYVGGVTSKGSAALGNQQDGFVEKVNPQGTAILYYRTIPAVGYSQPSIAVDAAGEVFFAGMATPNSNVFTTTPGAFQSTPPNDHGFNPVVVKLNAAGSAEVYATWVAGPNQLFSDVPSGIAVDAQGNAYLGGFTQSFSFPVTPGAYQTQTSAARGTAFIAKLNPAGSALVYSTYLGGSTADNPRAFRIDAQGRAYILGNTQSTDFPVTPGAFQPSEPQSQWFTYSGAFLASLNASGSVLNYSTYLDGAQFLDVDSAGNAYALGIAGPGFPVTSGAYQRCIAGGNVGAYIAQFDATGKVVGATYTGGPQTSDVLAIAAVPGMPNGVSNGRPGSVFTAVGNGVNYTVARVTIDDPANKPGPCSAQAIENSASFLLGPVAAGEIVTLRGDAFAPDAGVVSPSDRTAPRTLNGVQLFFDEIPAPLLYAQSRQINAIVPWEIAGRALTTIHVEYNGASTAAFTSPLVASAPGLFLANYVTAQGAIQNSDGSFNSRTNPAARGSIVAMYGTGGGPMSPAGVTGGLWLLAPLAQITLPVTVQINGFNAQVVYAGAAPGLVSGMFQINVRIPDGVSASGALPILLSIGGSVVNTTSIAVQ